jgi:hypothetical protein
MIGESGARATDLSGDTTLTVEQAWTHVKALLPATGRDAQRNT